MEAVEGGAGEGGREVKEGGEGDGGFWGGFGYGCWFEGMELMIFVGVFEGEEWREGGGGWERSVRSSCLRLLGGIEGGNRCLRLFS